MGKVKKVSYFQPAKTVTDLMGILILCFQFYGIQFAIRSQKNIFTTVYHFFMRCLMLSTAVVYFMFAAFVIYMNSSRKHQTLISLCLWLPLSAISFTVVCLHVYCLKNGTMIRNFFQELVNSLEDNCIKQPMIYAKTLKLSRIFFFSGFFINAIQCALFNYNAKQGYFRSVIVQTQNLTMEEKDELGWQMYQFLINQDFWVMVIFYSMVYSFLWLYTGLFCSTCQILSDLFECLSENSCHLNIQEYQKKHEKFTSLVKLADDVFGPFLFIGLVKEFLTMVLYFKVLCNFYSSLMDSLMAAYVVLLSLASFVFKVIEASKVNDKVYKALYSAKDVSMDYVAIQSNIEQMRHILFMEYCMQMFNSNIGFTAWKLMKVQKTLILTTVGTVLTYVIVLRELDQDQ